MVNFVSSRFRPSDEVSLIDIGLIFPFGDFQKVRQEGVTLLRPERIGNVQLDAFRPTGSNKLALEFAKSGRQFLPVYIKSKDFLHLLRCIVPCAGIGYGQCG